MTGSSEASGQDVTTSPYETGSRESSQERNERFQELLACSDRGFHSQSGEELRERYNTVTGRSFADVQAAFDSESRSSSQENLVQVAAIILSDIHVSPWISSWACVSSDNEQQRSRSPSPTRPRSPVFPAEFARPDYSGAGILRDATFSRDMRTMYPRDEILSNSPPEWEGIQVLRTYSPTDSLELESPYDSRTFYPTRAERPRFTRNRSPI